MNINPNAESSRSQRAKIRAHLEKGGTINAMYALNKFGCFRLGARISELRNDEGMEIKDRWITLISSHKKVKEYYCEAIDEAAGEQEASDIVPRTCKNCAAYFEDAYGESGFCACASDTPVKPDGSCKYFRKCIKENHD